MPVSPGRESVPYTAGARNAANDATAWDWRLSWSAGALSTSKSPSNFNTDGSAMGSGKVIGSRPTSFPGLEEVDGTRANMKVTGPAEFRAPASVVQCKSVSRCDGGLSSSAVEVSSSEFGGGLLLAIEAASSNQRAPEVWTIHGGWVPGCRSR